MRVCVCVCSLGENHYQNYTVYAFRSSRLL